MPGKDRLSGDIDMESNKAKQWLAWFVILGSSLFLAFLLYPIPPRLEMKPHEALGQILAEQAGKLLGTGGKLIVIKRDTDTFTMPAAEAQWDSFEKTLRRAGTPIAVTRLLKVDPLRAVSVPPGDFFEVLRKATEADVVVSFLGPPTLSSDQITKLQGRQPRVLAVCTALLPPEVDLAALFAAKLIRVAVINRKDPPPAPPTDPKTYTHTPEPYCASCCAISARKNPTS